MAAGYACMGDGDPHGARWLLTSLDPPATFTSCDEHFPVMMLPVLAANLDTDPDRLYDVVKRHLDREIAKAAKAARADNAGDNGPGPLETCSECGRLFGEVSPDCPHQIWDRHPRATAEQVSA